MGNRLLVKFHGIESREEAERLRGAVYALPDDVRQLQSDEYWPHDLIGCAVQDAEGRSFGEVEAVVPGPVQDLLQVGTSKGPRLVPLVKAIVTSIDVETRLIVVEPPPGLLDW